MISNDKYPLDDNLVMQIVDRLQVSGRFELDKLQLVGPFSMFIAAPNAFLEGNFRKSLVPIGHRLLILANGKPSAIVELHESFGDRRVGAIRFGEAAATFQKLIMAASEEFDTGRLRWLWFPPINTTVAWLSTRPNIFIPTRLNAVRTQGRPKYLRLSAIRELLRTIRTQNRAINGETPFGNIKLTTAVFNGDGNDASNRFVW